jgi:hypothetical protein
MSILKKLIVFSLVLFGSCAETPKKEVTKSNDAPQIDGVWERKGTIQFVNGKPVDTLFYGIDDTGEEEGFRNVKVYSEGNVLWVNNANDKANPWGAPGGYGKFEISKDTLTEFMSHGCGGMGAMLQYQKDSLGVSSLKFPFGYYLDDNTYTQLGGRVPNTENNIQFGEYYEKLPVINKTNMDGVWKRAYEISYVNGVAIDTTKVPVDAILDLKIIKDGYFMVVVDQTNYIKDTKNPEFGGISGYGQFEYDGKGNMIEYNEFGSWRGGVNNNTPRNAANAHYASVTFYDEDMYQQITKDTLNQTWRQDKERGVIYKRVQ